MALKSTSCTKSTFGFANVKMYISMFPHLFQLGKCTEANAVAVAHGIELSPLDDTAQQGHVLQIVTTSDASDPCYYKVS